MRRTILAGVAIALALPAAAQQGVLGTWRTQPDDDGSFGHVRIYECGPEFCGQLTRSFDASGAEVESAHVGKRIIWAMQHTRGGSFAKGKVHAPDRGRTYNSKLELQGDVLSVSGCILGICRAQNWSRVD